MRWSLLVVVLCAGCSGARPAPDATPDGVARAFVAAAEARDAEALRATLSAESLGVVGDVDEAVAAERIGPRVAGTTVHGWSRLRCRTFVHVVVPREGRDVLVVTETPDGWRVHLQDYLDAPTVSDPGDPGAAPREAVTAFLAAVQSRDQARIGAFFSLAAAEEFGPLIEGTEDPAQVEAFAQRTLGARVTGSRAVGCDAVVFVEGPSIREELRMVLTDRGWRILDF